jgi:hypothetical protein
MTAIRITLFGGIIPRLADRGLPDNAAQYAMNAKLYSGELRAWSRLRELATLPIANSLTTFHYRLGGVDKYLAFPFHTYVVKAPLVNETLERIYWSNINGVFVNTATRIDANQPAFRLGVPAPGGVFTVVPTGGTQANAVTRVYLATLVSSFGEESTTSTPVTVTGNSDGTWTVNGLNNLVVDSVNYPNITKLRLYRTISSSGGTDYRMVNEWLIGARPASYVDNITEVDIADNFALQSLGWDLPPAGLKGLIGVAGGFMAGFIGKTVYLSVPYQAQAWPADYQFAVEDNIVGLGTFGQTIVICTEGRGALLTGPSPDAMSLAKLEGVQPCLSARSIVSTVAGVMYASTDGLVLVDGGSSRAEIMSKAWVTKTEWMSQFGPATQMSSVYQDRYFSFYSDQLGLTVGFDDPVTGFTELQLSGVQSVDLDVLTGQTLITVGNKVYEWDGDATSTLEYQWRSKPFLVAKPVNMGAIQFRGTFVGSGQALPVPAAQGIGGYSINTLAVGAGKRPTKRYGGSLNGPPSWLALGVSPNGGSMNSGLSIKVYADGVLRWFGNVNDEEPHRLPSGYKAVRWEIEIQGSEAVYSAALAGTFKELEQVL